MNSCRILLFGSPLFLKNQQTVRIKLRKAVALLAYLAVQRRPASREFLATLLWPDQSQHSALANLRRTLSTIRTSFSRDCIDVNGDQVKLNINFVSVDVDEFQTLSAPTSISNLSCLEVATKLYRGKFMEGFSLGNCREYDEWQDSIRESFALKFDMLLENLSGRYLQADLPRDALPIARRRIELDCLNESAHRTLMEIYARIGRVDLAHKQYESCKQILENEGIELEDSTRELYEAINKHRFIPAIESSEAIKEADALESASGRKIDRLSITRKLPRILGSRPIMIRAVIAVFALVAISIFVVRSATGSEIKFSSLELLGNGNELDGIHVYFKNYGVSTGKERFAVMFNPNESFLEPPGIAYFGEAWPLIVYTDSIRVRKKSGNSMKIDCEKDIQRYAEKNHVDIPRGFYFAAAAIILTEKRDSYLFIDGVASTERFFYPGTGTIPVFEIDVAYNGQKPLNAANPLKLFISDRTQHPGSGGDQNDWGRLRITSSGKYYFPLNELPRHDIDDSGYFFLLVHDPGDNLWNPFFLDPDDSPALYKEVENNLVYGALSIAGGTPVFPDIQYSVDFRPPPKPKPDEYEVDDFLELGQTIDFDKLPVRQYHSFHMEGGDNDCDWFQINIPAGESLIIETYSAGGLWESDTSIDFSSLTDYIGGNDDKAPLDNYSKFSYTNNTGEERIFYAAVKPRIIPDTIRIEEIGEYIVEFR